MIQKTRGIVLRFTRYGDTSIIVTIFTDAFGIQSYIVNGVRSATAKSRIALYQPLNLLDLVVYHKQNANINRIREIRSLHTYHTLQTDPRKSSIALFICEILNKTVKEEVHSEEIFEFLYDSLIALDYSEASYENFHLMFLIKFSRYLGFGASLANEIIGPSVLTAEEETLLKELMPCRYDTLIRMTNLQRRNLLDVLIRFYGDHIDTLGEIRSVQVLRDIMS